MSPPVSPVPSDTKLPASVDVAVIGAGIIGTTAAYYLAKAGHNVALFDKGVVAGEQSSRNWGWVRQQHRDERELPLVRKAMEIWRGLSAELGEDVSFRHTGLLYVSNSEQELQTWDDWVNLAKTYGVNSHMLSGAEAKSRLPGSTLDWLGAVECPEDGRAEPSMAASAIARGARAQGALLFQNCAVQDIEVTNGKVSGLITEKGRVAANAVVCAGGAWTSMLTRRIGVPFPQAGVRATTFATKPVKDVYTGGLSTPGFTMRRRLDGAYTCSTRGLVNLEVTPQGIRYAKKFWPLYKARRDAGMSIRVGKSFFQGPESFDRKKNGLSPFQQARVLDPHVDMHVAKGALASIIEMYPELSGMEIDHVWGGWIDCTPDSVPVISKVDKMPGLIIASGFSGHGFGTGPAAGHLAADLVLDRDPIVDPFPFRYIRYFDDTVMPPARM